MIHAYAIQPEVVVGWGMNRQAPRLLEQTFGLGSPRVMLTLPKPANWRKLIVAEMRRRHVSINQRVRIEELMKKLPEGAYRRVDLGYDGLASWTENARKEFTRRPFMAVIVDGKNDGPFLDGLLILHTGDSRWDVQHSKPVPRMGSTVAEVLQPMLQEDGPIYLIDPHFSPYDPRNNKLIRHLANVAVKNKRRPTEFVIILEWKRDNHPELENFNEQTAKLAGSLPAHCTVSFRRVVPTQGARLHNRYVMSRAGGVHCGDSFETNKKDEWDAKDDFSVLERDHYLLRWAEYVDPMEAVSTIDVPNPIAGRV